jgi:hypothetical protein
MGPLFPFAKEGLLGEEDARRITQPYWSEFNEVWKSAIDLYQKQDEDFRARLGEAPCVPPINLNFLAQSFARERFSGREAEGLVECRAIPNTYTLYVTRQVLLRWNCFGRDFVVHNTNTTNLKDKYFRQEPIDGIEPSATRLTVGYRLNETKTDLAVVAISLQVDEDLGYYFFIDGTDDGTLSIPAPIEPPAPIRPLEELRKPKPR